MKLNKYHIIVFLGYTTLVAVLTYFLINRTTNTNDTGLSTDEQSVVDSLNTQISNLQYQQVVSDSLIVEYKEVISQLDYKINTTEKSIKQIRKKYESNSIKASRYTPNELDSFFTNRYN